LQCEIKPVPQTKLDSGRLKTSSRRDGKGGRPPGIPKTGGRTKGVQNKLNRDIKEMIIGALNDAGGQAYLAARAKDCPTAFLALVGRVLPMQVTGTNGNPIAVDFRWQEPDADQGLLDAQRPHTDALTIDGEIAPTEH
jgi:hypothetical protein